MCIGAHGHDAEFFVDGAHFLADLRKTEPEPCAAEDAGDAADDDGVLRADGVGHGSGEQTAEWGHADEGHGVVAHDAAAHFFIDERLQDGVAGGEALHHAEAGDEHHEKRKPEGVRESKGDESDAEDAGADGDDFGESAYGFAYD